MNRKDKLFTLIVSLVLCLCLSLFASFTAFADEEDTIPEQETYETEYIEPETEDTTPVETQAPETEYVEPETYAPETYEPETQAPVVTEQETYYYEDNQDDYDYDSGDSYSYEERESNVSSEKAETAAVYDVEEDNVSTDTLKKGDWAKIAEQLKNSNGDEGDDFAFIRNNDPNGANNGEWMLILGIILEALGVAIVVTLIVMKVRNDKAVKAGVGGGNGKGVVGHPKASKKASHAQNAPKAQRFTQKQRSKFDTADIAIPKHAKKPSGGTRYKPKH